MPATTLPFPDTDPVVRDPSLDGTAPDGADLDGADLDEVVASLGRMVEGLRPGALSTGQRTAWLRSLSRLDGLVAAGRSRLLSPDPATRSMPPAERSAELVRTTGVSCAEARRAVRLADTLQRVPAAASALADGTITEGHATVLATGIARHDRGAAADPSLLAAARSQTVDEFAATVAEWDRHANGDADGRLLAARQHRRRRAGWWTGPDGMIRIDAELAPDAGSVVTGALQSISEELWRTHDGRPSGDAADGGLAGAGLDGDAGRTIPQRHADALEEMARRAGAPAGTSGGRVRTDLVVTVGLDTLRTTPAGAAGESAAARKPEAARESGVAGKPEAARDRCVTADGVALTPTAVRRLACDAGVVPAVLGSDGAVLDVGRRTRAVGTALRHALVLCDDGCAFPGCDRPPSWCDAHHVRHWADGGPTDLDNLVLLCSAHHHLVHEGRWTIGLAADGRHGFRSPTGAHPGADVDRGADVGRRAGPEAGPAP